MAGFCVIEILTLQMSLSISDQYFISIPQKYLWFSGAFRGYRNGSLTWNTLISNKVICIFSSRSTFTSETIFDNWKPFKNDGKGFLFYLKISFPSQDIKIFVLIFRSCQMNFKFMTSQPGKQTVAMYMLNSISQRESDNEI